MWVLYDSLLHVIYCYFCPPRMYSPPHVLCKEGDLEAHNNGERRSSASRHRREQVPAEAQETMRVICLAQISDATKDHVSNKIDKMRDPAEVLKSIPDFAAALIQHRGTQPSSVVAQEAGCPDRWGFRCGHCCNHIVVGYHRLLDHFMEKHPGEFAASMAAYCVQPTHQTKSAIGSGGDTTILQLVKKAVEAEVITVNQALYRARYENEGLRRQLANTHALEYSPLAHKIGRLGKQFSDMFPTLAALLDNLCDNFNAGRDSRGRQVGRRYGSPIVQAVWSILAKKGNGVVFRFMRAVLSGPTLGTVNQWARTKSVGSGVQAVRTLVNSAFGFFKSIGYRPDKQPFSISFDGTKLTQRLLWTAHVPEMPRCAAGYIVGFDHAVGPALEFPSQELNGETVAQQVHSIVKNKPAAGYVIPFLLCPLGGCSSSARVVLLMPTDNTFSTATLVFWLETLIKAIYQVGFKYVNMMGADGDGRHRALGLSLLSETLAGKCWTKSNASASVGSATRRKLLTSAMLQRIILPFGNLPGLAPMTIILDPTHWLKKWSLTPFSTIRHILIGPKYAIYGTMLIEMQQKYGRDSGLLVGDVNLSDKMDYKAAERRLSVKVREKMMSDDPEKYLGVAIFLSMGDCVRVAFFNKRISAMERWHLLCRVLVFVRYWAAWVKDAGHDCQTTTITAQLEIDTTIMISGFAHMMIMYRDHYPEGTAFQPWLFGSDQNERCHSELRSMTPDGEFTLYECQMLVRNHHHIMGCWAHEDAAKALPPNLTRRGHNRSLYIPDDEAGQQMQSYLSDNDMSTIYSEEIRWVQHHILLPCGMDSALRSKGHFDTPPVEDLWKLATEDMEAQTDETANEDGARADVDRATGPPPELSIEEYLELEEEMHSHGGGLQGDDIPIDMDMSMADFYADLYGDAPAM